MKQNLRALILRTRGGHAFPFVLARVEEMSEAEAGEWYRLLSNLKDDAESDGARKGARQPWRHGGFR